MFCLLKKNACLVIIIQWLFTSIRSNLLIVKYSISDILFWCIKYWEMSKFPIKIISLWILHAILLNVYIFLRNNLIYIPGIATSFSDCSVFLVTCSICIYAVSILKIWYCFLPWSLSSCTVTKLYNLSFV